MHDQTDRFKRDLQTVENALGVNLWTRRDVRRGLLGVSAGAIAGLFLALWCACGGAPQSGLVVFLSILATIIVAKGIGFERQPAPAPGSHREVAFYNRFCSIGAAFVGGFYLWGQSRGLDPLTAFAAAIVFAGAWYVAYAISAPSRWISLAGAIPLTACGLLLPDARDFSQSLSWLGLAMCIGCAAEAALLLVALRPPPIPPTAPNAQPQPPSSPAPVPPLCHAAH